MSHYLCMLKIIWPWGKVHSCEPRPGVYLNIPLCGPPCLGRTSHALGRYTTAPGSPLDRAANTLRLLGVNHFDHRMCNSFSIYWNPAQEIIWEISLDLSNKHVTHIIIYYESINDTNYTSINISYYCLLFLINKS